jgi:hypothetical protein
MSQKCNRIGLGRFGTQRLCGRIGEYGNRSLLKNLVELFLQERFCEGKNSEPSAVGRWQWIEAPLATNMGQRLISAFGLVRW